MTIATTVETINYRTHPAAEVFPLIQGADFDALVADIREHGQRDPVVLDADNRLIDGRNRARACQALGIDVKETHFTGDDVAAFVVSHNLHRRHLTDSQRAMVAARLANLPWGANQHRLEESPIGDSSKSATRAEVKQLLGVSEGSMHRAKIIERKGSDDLIELTREGKVSLSSAVRVAETEPAAQEEFVKAVRAGTPPSEAAAAICPKEERAKIPKRKVSHSLAGRQGRADLIAELAAQGYSTRQMPVKVGVTEQSIRKIAKDFGIEIPADRTVGRTRRINSTQIVENTATALEGLLMGIELIDYEAVVPAVASQWIDSLDHSLRVLTGFIKQTRKTIQ